MYNIHNSCNRSFHVSHIHRALASCDDPKGSCLQQKLSFFFLPWYSFSSVQPSIQWGIFRNEDITPYPLTSSHLVSLWSVLVCPLFTSCRFSPFQLLLLPFSLSSFLFISVLRSKYCIFFLLSWSQQGETGVKNKQSGHRLRQCQLH